MFPAMGNGGNAQSDRCPPTIRIHVDLNKEHPEENVFDYQELLEQVLGGDEETSSAHASGQAGPSGMESGGDESDSEDGGTESSRKTTAKPKRRVADDEYDLDDEFIDDSDMFFAEVGHVAPTDWDFGFFAWRGPVENFFEEQAPNPFEREAPATATKPKGKKKATAGSAEKKAANGTSEKKGKATTTKKGKKASGAVSSAPVSPKETEQTAMVVETSTTVTSKATVTLAAINTPTAEKEDGPDFMFIDKTPHTPTRREDRETVTSDDDVPLSKLPQITNKVKNAGEVDEENREPLRKAKESKKTTKASEAVVTPVVSTPTTATEPTKKKAKKKKVAEAAGANQNSMLAQGEGTPIPVPEPTKPLKKKQKAKKEKDKDQKREHTPASTPKLEETTNGLPRRVQKHIELLREAVRGQEFNPDEPLPAEVNSRLQSAAKRAHELSCLDSTFYDRLVEVLPLSREEIEKTVNRFIIPRKLDELKPAVKQMYINLKTKVDEILVNTNSAIHLSPNGESPTKFEWTEDLRTLFWNILCSEWEMALLDNSFRILLGKEPSFTEGGVRKAVYTKVLSYWPEGLMTPDTLSRIYSQIKKKLEKYVENGRDLGELKADPFRSNKRKSAPPVLEGSLADDSPAPAAKKQRKKSRLSLGAVTHDDALAQTPNSSAPPSPAKQEPTKARPESSSDTSKRPQAHDDGHKSEKHKKQRKTNESPADDVIILDTPQSSPARATNKLENDYLATHIPNGLHQEAGQQAQDGIPGIETTRERKKNGAHVMSLAAITQ